LPTSLHATCSSKCTRGRRAASACHPCSSSHPTTIDAHPASPFSSEANAQAPTQSLTLSRPLFARPLALLQLASALRHGQQGRAPSPPSFLHPRAPLNPTPLPQSLPHRAPSLAQDHRRCSLLLLPVHLAVGAAPLLATRARGQEAMISGCATSTGGCAGPSESLSAVLRLCGAVGSTTTVGTATTGPPAHVARGPEALSGRATNSHGCARVLRSRSTTPSPLACTTAAPRQDLAGPSHPLLQAVLGASRKNSRKGRGLSENHRLI
jgi:hypothetical protein